MTLKPTIGPNRADGDIPNATDWDRDVVQQGLYMQELAAGTNGDKIPASAISGAVGFYPNLLVNGGMEVSQRGTGVFNATAGGVVVCDRWVGAISGSSTATMAQQAAIDTGSQFAFVFNYTHVGGGSGVVLQRIENWQELKGRQLYCTARVHGSTTGMYLALFDGTAQAVSTRTVAGTVQTLSCTLTVSNSATTVQVGFNTDATGVFTIDSVMLAASSAAIGYIPRPFAEEMALCQRYYQKVKLSTRWRALVAGEGRDTTVLYKAAMSGVPTGTLTAGTRVNIATASLLDLTADGARVEYSPTAGTATTGTDTQALNEVVTLEHNP